MDNNTNDTNKKDKWVCMTTIKRRGFTQKLIDDLLPEPLMVPNPNGSKFAPMKLWKEADVESAMKNELFQAKQAKREARKAAAQKAVQTKTDKLLAEVEERVANIKVTVIDLKELEKKTIKAKQDWYDYLEERCCHKENYDYCDYYDYYEPAGSADKETRERWMVNYVRHNLTLYDDELLELYNRTGKGKAYMKLYSGIMEKIADAYPKFSDECKRQIEYKKAMMCCGN